MLAPFIKWLEERKMIDFALIADDTDDGFSTRFRVQKYVFTAQHMGLGTGYEYSRYRYGPYSPRLTTEYYRLADNPNSYTAESKGSVPEQFRSIDFLNTVAGRDDQWLEVATTLIDMSPQHDSTERLVDHVSWIKSAYPKEYTKEVIEDLCQSPMREVVTC